MGVAGQVQFEQTLNPSVADSPAEDGSSVALTYLCFCNNTAWLCCSTVGRSLLHIFKGNDGFINKLNQQNKKSS